MGYGQYYHELIYQAQKNVIFMEKNVDHESKRDLLYVIVIIVLAIIYALLFTLDPLEKNYSQVMVMAILT